MKIINEDTVLIYFVIFYFVLRAEIATYNKVWVTLYIVYPVFEHLQVHGCNDCTNHTNTNTHL